MFSVEVLEDSVNLYGDRLTTFKLTFPRFILAELNTHRMFSRNSASSRAIPPDDTYDEDGNIVKKGLITKVKEDPFVPLTFNSRVKGMGVGAALDEASSGRAESVWRDAAQQAVYLSQELCDIGLDKSRINRLLEPYMWHTAIVSATDWANFYALRNHLGAQPEFQMLAAMMQDAHEASEPVRMSQGWHLPMVSAEERQNASPLDWDKLKKTSAGRVARVSYDTQDNFEPQSASVERADALANNGHFSPFEHVARPITEREAKAATELVENYRAWCEFYKQPYDSKYADSFYYRANFRGWVQMRYSLPHENDFSKADW